MTQQVSPALDFPRGNHHDSELRANARPADWRNPKPREAYHFLVIGAGPAGLTAARDAAALGARVALIESHLLGGVSLNYGSVPSKALIRTARLYAQMRNAANFGVRPPGDVEVDFTLAMERMRRIRSRISRFDSAARLTAAGVDVFFRRHGRRGRHPVAVQEGDDCHGVALDGAGDPGPGRSRLPHQRDRFRPHCATVQHARDRRRPGRV
jgi:hypothetical protein